MKQVILLLTLTLVLVSCGSKSGHFKIEGRFLNLNQGEFYVYSPDGAIDGLDTIKVNGGRFALDIPCQRKGTLMLVFPNFSEQPIFAEPGGAVDIKADASHLKEMEVSGTDDNELMTTFRKTVAALPPREVTNSAEAFIKDNPKTDIAVYLLRRYFALPGNKAALDKGAALLAVLQEAQPKNGTLVKLAADMKLLRNSATGNTPQSFSAADVNGGPVSSAQLRGRKYVVLTWAMWDYESQNIVRRVSDLLSSGNASSAVVGICVDADKERCRDFLKSNDIKFQNICDGQLFESPLLRRLGLHAVPDNIVVGADGKVVARGVSADDLERYMK